MSKWLTAILCQAVLAAQSWAASPYVIGAPALQDLWIDPVNGSDSHSGASREAALKTLQAGWNQVPAATPLSRTGYRLRLLPGSFACEPGPETDNCQNDLASRWGSAQAPVIIEAADGPGSVTLRGGLNLRDLRYVYLLNLTLAGGGSLPTNASGNNLLHIEGGDHLLLRGLNLVGPACDNDGCNNLQEVLKVNQTQHLYVEDSQIGGAWHSSVDYFAVQYGHFIGNRIHTAGQWGMYVKGGSAYLLIEGNTFSGTQLGFQAGQSANFAMLRSPWLHYEAYDIRFINNVLHDIPGVGVSVAGGYNVLIAHNILYRVGTAVEPGYPMMSFVYGERNCTATDELPDPLPVCQANAAAGGWGPVVVIEGQPVIPNRNVLVFNNVLHNPTGSQTRYGHFAFDAPLPIPAGLRNIPASARVDDGLVIRGNLIWNGPADLPTGAGDSACLPTNALCNDTQLRADNQINTVEPQWVAAEQGNLRPRAGSPGLGMTGLPIPDFSWVDAPAMPVLPTGAASNTVARDADALLRGTPTPPGAYRRSDSLPPAQWMHTIDCLFDWAQNRFPQWLTPTTASATLEPYYYRSYRNSQTYLAGLRDDQHVWLQDGAALSDLGATADLAGQAGCL